MIMGTAMSRHFDLITKVASKCEAVPAADRGLQSFDKEVTRFTAPPHPARTCVVAVHTTVPARIPGGTYLI
jgi:hypothetical protein